MITRILRRVFVGERSVYSAVFRANFFVDASCSGKPRNCNFLMEQRRCFAKAGDRGGQKKLKANFNDSSLTDVLDVDDVRLQMQKEVDRLREEYATQLNVRLSLQAFERIPVKVDDKERGLVEERPLNHLAQLTFKTPQLVIVNMAMSPHAVKAAAEAIGQSGFAVNPQIDGNTIFVPVQKPSREQREKLATNAKALFNRCVERLRAVQKTISVKQMRPLENKISKEAYTNATLVLYALVQEYTQKSDDLMKAKQKELMEEIK